MNTTQIILLVIGFAVLGGGLYCLQEWLYYSRKYRPKNEEIYKEIFNRILLNQSKLVKVKSYEPEIIGNILLELQSDLASFKHELGFMARRDYSTIFGLRNQIKGMLNSDSRISDQDSRILSSRRIQMLNYFGNNLLQEIKKINKKVC
jgi:hypothetical protein